MTKRIVSRLIAGFSVAGLLFAALNCSSSPQEPPFKASTGQGGSGGIMGGGGMDAGGMGGQGGQSCDVNLCPGTDTTCSKRACEGTECKKVNAPQETKCSEDGGKLCDGMGNCVKCLKKEDCSGSDICQDKKCVPAACVNMMKDNA
jgi:hypothetical protein